MKHERLLDWGTRLFVFLLVTQIHEILILSFLSGLILIPLFIKINPSFNRRFSDLKVYFINCWMLKNPESSYFFGFQFLIGLSFGLISVFLSLFGIDITDIFYFGIFDNSHRSPDGYIPGLPSRYQ